MSTSKLLFSEAEIATRVDAMARQIVALTRPPELLVGILAGAFMMTADLARALARQGLPLPIEFLWLRSYGEVRTGGEVRVVVGATNAVRGKHVMVIDGVLDVGRTLVKAKELLLGCGAFSVLTAVVVDKLRPDALLKADFAAFQDVGAFVVGYGMDDGGKGRALPYIAKATS
ncbi:MAG TPA: phosphoribosyltransferase family protein [Rhizomicrobium sp.]